MKLKFGDKGSINWLKRIKKQWYERNIEPVDVDMEEISFEACCCMSFKRKEWDLPSLLVKELLEEKGLLVLELRCIYFKTCKLKDQSYYLDDNCECLCRKEVITDLDGNFVSDSVFNDLQLALPFNNGE